MVVNRGLGLEESHWVIGRHGVHWGGGGGEVKQDGAAWRVGWC